MSLWLVQGIVEARVTVLAEAVVRAGDEEEAESKASKLPASELVFDEMTAVAAIEDGSLFTEFVTEVDK